MKKLYLLLPLLLLAGLNLLAEDRMFVLPSLDAKGDSAAVLAMRHRMDSIRRHRPTVALVLAGGGAKGAAHVGVLKFMEENNIPIDLITGTSMGGLVGGLYSLGYRADELDSLLRSMDWTVMMSDRIPKYHIGYQDKKYKETFALSVPWYYENDDWKKRVASGIDMEGAARKRLFDERLLPFRAGIPDGYLYGLNVHNTLSSMTVGYQDSLEFRKLPIPFFCVATDLVSQREKNWMRGQVVDALRSTMSIPFLFKPLRKNGMVLIDGGMRNNMPVDIARAMGADIVIAVDLSETTESEKNVNTIFDVMMQSFNVMSRDAYDANIGNIDVYLHPDLSGYNMLSFSAENIADIIGKGYQEAQNHSDELAGVARCTGAEGTRLSAPPATDMGRTPVVFSAIRFEGLTPVESRYFEGRLQPGTPYLKSDVESLVADIYATGCFETVTWQVKGDREPYELTIRCSKGPVHHFGLGLRADTEEIVSLGLNLSFWAHRLYGSRLDATVKLGVSPYARVEYAYRFLKGPQLSLSLDTRYVDYDSHNRSYLGSRDSNQDDRYRFWTNDLTFRVRSRSFPFLDMYAGFNAGNIPYYHFNSLTRNDWNVHFSALAHLAYDTQDDGYFPERGGVVQADYQFVFGSRSFSQNGQQVPDLDGFPPYHIAALHLRRVFPIGDFAILASLHGRYVSRSYDDVLFIHRNYAGGYVPGRMVPDHMPLRFINGVNQFERIVAILDIDFRYKFLEKNFITLSVCTLNQAPDFKNFRFTLADNAFACGFSLQYGRKTIAGPLRAGINWNTIDRRVGFYLGIGYDF